MIYAWLLSALVLLDTTLTIVAISWFGAVEANPLMAWLLAKSVLLFIAVKLIPVVCLIYLATKIGKPAYLALAFWCYLLIFACGLLKVNVIPAKKVAAKPLTSVVVKTPPKKSVVEKWNTGVVTVYADKFEGRTMANGKRFHHNHRVLACRKGSFRQKIEIQYGKNGKTICVLSDRGRLPLHKPNRWQFDLTKAAAKDLGLYRIVNGKTDRVVRWRYIK
jgi:hypothetical protein